nr:DUF202 domain-containing protein [Arthrobacter sp. UNC362MFTsu5.1]
MNAHSGQRLQPPDPGLQPERTSLAWRRTFLALLVADFFIWRAWLSTLSRQPAIHPPSSLGLGLASAAAAAATIVFAVCVLVRTGSLRRANAAPPALLLRAAAAAVLVLAASVAVSVALSA